MYSTLFKGLIFALFSCFWRNAYFCSHICARIRPEYLPLFFIQYEIPVKCSKIGNFSVQCEILAGFHGINRWFHRQMCSFGRTLAQTMSNIGRFSAQCEISAGFYRKNRSFLRPIRVNLSHVPLQIEPINS